jgi:hypothetical protein
LWELPECAEYHLEKDYCSLGFGHLRSGNAVASGSIRKAGNGHCHYRAIYERKSLHVIDRRRQDEVLVRFMESMRKHSFTAVYFLGDSVNSQLSHFVVCDFLRSDEGSVHVHACPGWNDLYTGDRHSGCNMVSHRYGSDLTYNVSFYSNRFAPCTDGSCKDSSKVAGMFEHVFRGLRSFFESHLGSVVVFNTGLHTPSRFRDDVYNNVTLNLAEQLLTTAVELQKNGNLLVFRESTAQHFPYSEDGSYDPMGVVADSFCCSAEHIRHNISMNRNDLELFNKLDELDTGWKGRLGWAQYYQHTLAAGEDLHIETNKDCTHFIYNPEGGGASLSNTLLDSVAASADVVAMYHRKSSQAGSRG